MTKHFYDGHAATKVQTVKFSKLHARWVRGVTLCCIPSVVQLGCILCRCAPGVAADVSRWTTLFSIVQSSKDYGAQVLIPQHLQHGTFGVYVDHVMQHRSSSVPNPWVERRFLPSVMGDYFCTMPAVCPWPIPLTW